MRERRRQFKPEFKARLVIELLTGTTTMAQACQKYQLKQQVVSRWKSDFMERAPEVFAGNAQHETDQERIAELERLVGRLTMQIEILKKASRLLD